MNKEVVVVTDSTACLTEQMAREHHVTVVPIWVIFGEYSYRDGVDMPGHRSLRASIYGREGGLWDGEHEVHDERCGDDRYA